MAMRDQIWNKLFNTKYKAVYACDSARWATHLGNGYSILLVLGTSGSIAAWSLWKTVPVIWAIVVGAGQLGHVIKPYLPFIGAEKAFLTVSFAFERLVLDYERLWKKLERHEIDEILADDILAQLQAKERDIVEKNPEMYPDFEFIAKSAHDETLRFMKVNFS